MGSPPALGLLRAWLDPALGVSSPNDSALSSGSIHGRAQGSQPRDRFDHLLHLLLGDLALLLLAGFLQSGSGQGVDRARMAAGTLDEGVHRWRLKGIAVDGGLLQAVIDVLTAFCGIERGHFETEADAAQERLVDPQQKAGHEVVVADKEGAEAGA